MRVALALLAACLIGALTLVAARGQAAFPGPNGQIAFARAGSVASGAADIYAMSPEGSGFRRLTDNPAYDLFPAYSPDGTTIAFTTGRDGNAEIYTMNAADGSNQLNRTNDRADDFQPAFSHDGTRIVFTRQLESSFSSREIFIMNADGSGQRRLTSNGADDETPVLSPDGTKIAFASDRDSSSNSPDPDIFIMNADGSGVVRLTDQISDVDPSFSPDGRKIAFASRRDQNQEIYTMNADGSGVVRLTNNRDFDVDPSFSPDGTKIAFTTRPVGPGDSRDQIFTMNADGTGQANRTNDSSCAHFFPDWGPRLGSPGGAPLTPCPTPPPPQPQGEAAPPPSRPAVQFGAPISSPTVTVARRRLRATRRGVVSLVLTCRSFVAGSCSGTLSLSTAAANGARRKVTILGRARFRVATGRSGRVKVKLSRKGFGLLKRRRRLRVTTSVAARDSAANQATATVPLTLEAPRRR